VYSFFYKIPFYKRLWAKLLAVLLGCVLLFYLYQRRQRKKLLQERERFEMRNKIANMENQALQSLMHPHFVFNSLNSIQSFINNNDATNANRFLSRFAKLMRLNLNAGINGFITIEDEIERLQLYLSLEQQRFENKFTFNIHSQKQLEIDELYLPSMILQPFIENSIWHGILPGSSKGKIDINFNIVDRNNVDIIIVDNGVGVEKSKLNKQDKKHESKGLKLIASRMQILSEKYEKPFVINESVPFPTEENVGHQVIVNIPYLYKEDLY
jgi:LytS/YehU family sensor histidine kinase